MDIKKVYTQENTNFFISCCKLATIFCSVAIYLSQIRPTKSFKLVVLSGRGLGFSGRLRSILACNSHFFSLMSFAVRLHFKESIFCFNFVFAGSVLQHEVVPSIWMLASGVSVLWLCFLVSSNNSYATYSES